MEGGGNQLHLGLAGSRHDLYIFCVACSAESSLRFHISNMFTEEEMFRYTPSRDMDGRLESGVYLIDCWRDRR